VFTKEHGTQTGEERAYDDEIDFIFLVHRVK
jgi:hypothetical protein